MRVTGDPRRVTASVVSPKWLVFCGKGFSVQARRERRTYPEVGLQGVSNEGWSEKDCRPLGCAQFGLWLRCSSVTAPLWGMLPPRASPRAKLGATKHQPFRRHNTSVLIGETTSGANQVLLYDR